MRALLLILVLASVPSAFAGDDKPSLFASCRADQAQYDFYGAFRKDAFTTIQSRGTQVSIPSAANLGTWMTYKVHFILEGRLTTIEFSNFEEKSVGTLISGSTSLKLQCRLVKI